MALSLWISRAQPEKPTIARQALLQATGPRQDEVPSVARTALDASLERTRNGESRQLQGGRAAPSASRAAGRRAARGTGPAARSGASSKPGSGRRGRGAAPRAGTRARATRARRPAASSPSRPRRPAVGVWRRRAASGGPVLRRSPSLSFALVLRRLFTPLFFQGRFPSYWAAFGASRQAQLDWRRYGVGGRCRGCEMITGVLMRALWALFLGRSQYTSVFGPRLVPVVRKAAGGVRAHLPSPRRLLVVNGRVGQPRRRLEAASRPPAGARRQRGGPAARPAQLARATAPVAADGIPRRSTEHFSR